MAACGCTFLSQDRALNKIRGFAINRQVLTEKEKQKRMNNGPTLACRSSLHGQSLKKQKKSVWRIGLVGNITRR